MSIEYDMARVITTAALIGTAACSDIRPTTTPRPSEILYTQTLTPELRPHIALSTTPWATGTTIEATVEPTMGWQTPSPETWTSLMEDPNFLHEIAINQFDLNQYGSLDLQNKQEFANADYPGNSCGEAVIAELIDMYTFRKTGNNPSTTIADVINELIRISVIRANGTEMTDFTLKLAIDYFGQLNDRLFSTVPLTSLCNGVCTSAIPGSDWGGLFKTAEESVLKKGGVLVGFVQKGGDPPGSLGHFIIIGSFSSGGEPLIIDSLDGSARVIGLGAYVDVQPGLLSLFGVVPTP